MQEIFSGKEIFCIGNISSNKDLLMVSFGYAKAEKERNNIYFGVRFFKKHSIDYIAIDAKVNNWWQTREIFELIEKISRLDLLAGYRNIVCYGSSMGGYGALLFSKLFRANSVIAFSPQYSIDPLKVPFENRFPEANKLNYFFDDISTFCSSDASKYVFCDPYDIDGAHANIISCLSNVSVVKIPFSGHTVTHFLSEIGELESVVFELVENRFSVLSFRKMVRSNRRKSSKYWFNLAAALYKRNRNSPSLAISMAKNSFEISRVPKVARFVALRYLELNNFIEARNWFELALDCNDDLFLTLRSMINFEFDSLSFSNALRLFSRCKELRLNSTISESEFSRLRDMYISRLEKLCKSDCHTT